MEITHMEVSTPNEWGSRFKGRPVSELWFFSASLLISLFLGLPSFAVAATYGEETYGAGTYAGVPPTVTTDSASPIGQTSAILGGTITNTGTTTPSVRGFAYGIDTSYGATTTDSSGPFSTGSFTASVSGLTCNTGYRFRAYATSTNGIGYGGNATFTTSACSTGGGGGGNGPIGGSLSVGYQAGTSTVSSSPSLSVYVSTSSNSVSPVSNPSLPAGTAFQFTHDLERGIVGDDVRELQKFLNTHGFVISQSGLGSPGQETTTFGPATQASLVKFQQANGITPAAGYFGPKTKIFIANMSGTQSPQNVYSNSSISFTRGLALGMQGKDVRQLQVYLNAHGFPVASSGNGSPGQESDYFGPATQGALATFQRANGITTDTGYFGPRTRALIVR